MSNRKEESVEPNQELFGCSHLKLINYQGKQFCHHCGVFINNTNLRVLRTLKLRYSTYFDPTKILEKVLKPTSYVYEFSMNSYYKNQRSKVIEFMCMMAKNLTLSQNSVFLGVIYLDKLMHIQEISEMKLYFYASAALMLAAKSIDVDQNIPLISEIKKSAPSMKQMEVNYFSAAQFKQAELAIIKAFDWNLQVITLLDRVECILAMGVLDDDDFIAADHVEAIDEQGVKTINRFKNLKDLDESALLMLVKGVEDKYQNICLRVLQEPIYFECDQVILALSVISYLRKSGGVINVWSQNLQVLTKISATDLSAAVSQLELANLHIVTPIKEIIVLKQHQPPSFLSNQTSANRTSQLLQSSSLYCEPFKSTARKSNLSYLNENSSTSQSTHSSYLQGMNPPNKLIDRVKFTKIRQQVDSLQIKYSYKLDSY